VLNTEDEPVVWQQEEAAGLSVLRMGTKAQPVLAKAGDDLRIDWGYLYVAANRSETRDSIPPTSFARVTSPGTWRTMPTFR
jgi:hypothetical protein